MTTCLNTIAITYVTKQLHSLVFNDIDSLAELQHLVNVLSCRGNLNLVFSLQNINIRFLETSMRLMWYAVKGMADVEFE